LRYNRAAKHLADFKGVDVLPVLAQTKALLRKAEVPVSPCMRIRARSFTTHAYMQLATLHTVAHAADLLTI
jgi:hypothetical protein